MKNREWLQFLGFLSTPPLWIESKVFPFKQFTFPEVELPAIIDLKEEIPSLQSNFVLGKRIESFYSLLLERSESYSIIAQGLQIFRDKITLGELDFLLETNVDEEIIHLEVVYKFYVYDPGIKVELERWIGPNRKDTLLKKLNKLEQKQLPMLYREETTKAITPFGIAEKTVQQQVSFLAHLFLPKHIQKKDLPHINQQCIAGTWIHHPEFTPGVYGCNEFYIPPKQDWPIEPSLNLNWFPYMYTAILIEQIITEKRSPLVWMKNKNNTFERFFIVWW